MKNILTTVCAILLITSASFGQGNLQFNQVVLITLNIDTPQAFTVPAGKVWKIQSAGVGTSSTSIYLRDSAGEGLAILYSTSSDVEIKFPYWLPTGFTGDFRRFGNTSTAPKATVSIIEFNVIP